MRPNRIARVPIRTCAGCRSRRRQEELIRVLSGEDGDVIVDPGPRGATKGRGAYVCPDPSCIKKAMKVGFKKALRYRGTLPATLESQLTAIALKEREGNDGEAQGS